MAWAIMPIHEEEWAVLEVSGIDATQRYTAASYAAAVDLIQALENQALMERGWPVGTPPPASTAKTRARKKGPA